MIKGFLRQSRRRQYHGKVAVRVYLPNPCGFRRFKKAKNTCDFIAALSRNTKASEGTEAGNFFLCGGVLAQSPRPSRACAMARTRSAWTVACSIRGAARVQLGMRKGDHDMVHGLACMRGCSLVVQRVERGANFKNRV